MGCSRGMVGFYRNAVERGGYGGDVVGAWCGGWRYGGDMVVCGGCVIWAWGSTY